MRDDFDDFPGWIEDLGDGENGFSDADLAGPPPELEISPDFVERCAEAVRRDQEQIRAEAARVDDVQFERALLDAYAPPASGDRTVDRIHSGLLDHAASHPDPDAWREALAQYRVPAPSGDFVERTLAALRGGEAETPARSAPGAPVPPRFGLRRLAGIALPLAAAAALALLLFWPEPGSSSRDEDHTLSAQAFSPAPWGTALERRREGLRFEPADGLLLLAAQAETGEAR